MNIEIYASYMRVDIKSTCSYLYQNQMITNSYYIMKLMKFKIIQITISHLRMIKNVRNK